MPSYTKNFRNTTRTTFAREATIDAFGSKAIQALDEPGFEGRRPHEPPRRLSDIAALLVRRRAA